MIVVGITGGVGCGKTTIAKTLIKKKFAVINCDKIVAKLYKNEKLKSKLKKIFGTAEKKKISKIVFSAERLRKVKMLKKLNSIFHPLVRREIKKILKKYKQTLNLVFIETPLLFEARMEKMFDFIIVVKCTKEQQIRRVMKKFKISKREAIERINMQLPIHEKVKRANFVIDNSKSIAETKKQIEKIVQMLEEISYVKSSSNKR